MKNKTTVWFDEVGKEDVGLVGGKGANLGEMYAAKIPVPYGFIVTAGAYFDFIKTTKLDQKIKGLLQSLNYKNTNSLEQTASLIQKSILKEKMPVDLAKEIMRNYLELSSKSQVKSNFTNKFSSYLKNPYVAVRSSATAEDLPDASFAGQQATFLNVSGEANVVKYVQEAWASLYTPRAIFYREEKKFEHLKVGIAVVIQMMIASESSGVMFTLDPVTNDKSKIVIEGILGLGELIVQGSVTPDHYEVDKKDLKITIKKIERQTVMLVKKNDKNVEIKPEKEASNKQKVNDDQIIEIARLGKILEKHYYFPQDVEWAIENGNIYIVQTRPVTTVKPKGNDKKEESSQQNIFSKMKLLLKGDPASPGISSGPVKVIYSAKEIDKIKAGDILVTIQTNPDFVPAMKRAVAIITERGGRTSHAAIVGTVNATKVLKTGMVVTVHGLKGEVYQGGLSKSEAIRLEMSEKKSKPNLSLKTATKVYANLATPTRIDQVAAMNVDGVGLLRAEFMIADIGTHPKKLIKEHKEKIFISKLSADLLKFCKAFNPRPVVYRATDFKTNEYRNLIGGSEFEPEEPNPMLGYRGAFRYMSDPKVFELELETIMLIRNKYGYKNLWLMLPFVRTVRELVEVKKIIAASGLSRSPSFKLWMMVEIPSNAIILDQFCEAGIDGVSIGSNDLTMLILGTDRDNTEVASEFDERNPAVLWAIERVVKTCKKYGVTSSICGQAPSDYPELVEKLVNWGITSMSVNADAIDQVRETIYNVEQKMGKK